MNASKLMAILTGILGCVILAISGWLILFGIQWAIWNAPLSGHPPTDIAWLVNSAVPLGFFLLGLGFMMILWSKPLSVQ
ncbi:MAG: hypothetical protein BAJATHORv1_30029 [Candidatus Thorarchaeota archaeon]|nr:MAG: hypothetical protein BAJATHORv1_30029 [Candidatus Thorarchaeota archaeon]